MRYFIIALLVFSCYSSTFSKGSVEKSTVAKNLNDRLFNISKKQRNSLKKGPFSGQIDVLSHIGQNKPIIALHFIKSFQGSALHLTQLNFENTMNVKLYPYIFQYLYIKHGFW